jgi:hypothetical protein
MRGEPGHPGRFALVSLTRPQHPGRVAIVAGVLVLVVTAAIYGASQQENGPAAVQRPGAIVQLTPEEGQLALPQDMVGVQVRTDFTAQLTLNGHNIPQDQITGDPNLGEFYFQPGPNKEFRELPKGQNEAIVEWWPRTISTAEQARAERKLASYRWPFNVG